MPFALAIPFAFPFPVLFWANAGLFWAKVGGGGVEDDEGGVEEEEPEAPGVGGSEDVEVDEATESRFWTPACAAKGGCGGRNCSYYALALDLWETKNKSQHTSTLPSPCKPLILSINPPPPAAVPLLGASAIQLAFCPWPATYPIFWYETP